ncbi:MAG: DUF4198 domain-containing protein [Candidatus Accumulibacter sp.]|jgi:hypothetical protein|nr:DUF4198 domain-containing protein [Accumulibacter sp.]
MKPRTLSQILCAGIAAMGLCSAEAHEIWLEQPEGENAILRFGEFAENLREASPGLLDNFVAPTATLFAKGKTQALAFTKTATGFGLPVRLASGESLTAEDARLPIRASSREGRPEDGTAPRQREGRTESGTPQQREGRAESGTPRQREGRGGTRSWHRPAARLITDFSAQAPSLALDIVPTGNPGVFQVTFHENPLPRTSVEISVQSGWSKRARTDDEGRVSFDLPWRGQYVLSVSHADPAPGERDGEKYDAIHYATTLTLVQPAGVAPFPAGPAAQPNPGRQAR